MKEQIIEKLIEYIRTNCPTVKDVSEIPLDEKLFDLDILDSFAIVEMIAFIESNWSIKLLDSEITNEFFKGLNRISEIILSKL